MESFESFPRFLLGVIVLTALGCGGGGSTFPEGPTGTVTGTVKYKGAAVPEGSTVLFVQQDGGFIANGTTDASGNYHLLMKSTPNVLTGAYSIGVTPPAVDLGLSDEEIMEKSAAGTLPEPPKSPIPEKYLAAESSPLVFNVKEGENTIDLDLVD